MSDNELEPCHWCRKPSVAERVVVPAGGRRVWPVTAPVCKEHSDMIDRNLREIEAEKARKAAKRVKR